MKLKVIICAVILGGILTPAHADSLTIITIVKDTSKISSAELKSISDIVKIYVPLVTKAWGLSTMNVNYSDTVVAGTWNVFLTDKNRQKNSAGYHDVENGFPTAYVSPSSSMLDNKLSRKVRSNVLWGMPSIGYPGFLNAITHEIAEMIVNPNLTNKGSVGLIEICDPLNDNYFVIGKAVVADFALPSLFNPKGVAPFSHANTKGLVAGESNEYVS